MCGIAGHIVLNADSQATNATQLEAATRRMCTLLTHRGPDAHSFWSDKSAGISLGHQRLSIIDLSDAGAQPMLSATGRYVIVYNGEIYGFRTLAKELGELGARFNGHSDTEVLLAAIEQWGLTEALSRINGMFALALWDRQTRQLSFARDRAGKKPLYLARTHSGIAFASELGPLLARDDVDKKLAPSSVAQYLRFMAVPAPATIIDAAWQLPPAHVLTIDPALPLADLGAAVRTATPFWSAASIAAQGQERSGTRHPQINDADALTQLTGLLGAAVSDRMVADVPLGAFLSGGIDSTCVVTAMCEHATAPVETYTIGFEETGYNEADHARNVAEALGTDHHELILTGTQARDIIPRLPDIYSEPFADSSQIPTFLISQFARSRVTVALSGDGGDEVFGGYNRHIYAQRLAGILDKWPYALRATVSAVARTIPPRVWDTLLVPAGQPQAGDRLHKLAKALGARNADELYLGFQSVWNAPQTIVQGVSDKAQTLPSTHLINLPTLAGEMMLGDYLLYLPTDPLHKVDRASMAVSLEVRSPLLDQRLFEFAWSLPEHLKVKDGKGKWILQEYLARRLPRAVMDRPKQGFGIPLGDWLRGPLREWAEDLLTPQALARDGLLNPQPIREAWARHLAGRENLSNQMWAILMLQAWRQRWGK